MESLLLKKGTAPFLICSKLTFIMMLTYRSIPQSLNKQTARGCSSDDQQDRFFLPLKVFCYCFFHLITYKVTNFSPANRFYYQRKLSALNTKFSNDNFNKEVKKKQSQTRQSNCLLNLMTGFATFSSNNCHRAHVMT